MWNIGRLNQIKNTDYNQLSVTELSGLGLEALSISKTGEDAQKLAFEIIQQIVLEISTRSTLTVPPIKNPTILTNDNSEGLEYFSCNSDAEYESFSEDEVIQESNETWEPKIEDPLSSPDIMLASVNQFSLGGNTACTYCSLTLAEKLLTGSELNKQTMSLAVREGVKRYFESDHVGCFVSPYQIISTFSRTKITREDFRKMPEENTPEFFKSYISELFDGRDHACAILVSSNKGHSTLVGKIGHEWIYTDSAGTPELLGTSEAVTFTFDNLDALANFVANQHPFNSLNPITENSLNFFGIFKTMTESGYSEEEAKKTLLQNLNEIGIASLPESITPEALEAHQAYAFNQQIPNMIDLTLIELA